MCDTLVVTGTASRDGASWLGKNSDREPGEAQRIEVLPPRIGNARVRCTHIEIPDVGRTARVILSRPAWMWGAEMGVNEHGLAIGNEAVFTKNKPARTGLTGMDLLRLALERARSSREAIDVIAELLAAHGQGGACGYRNKGFSYSSSFLLVDAREAWVMETAGNLWAASRAHGVRSISNGLTLGVPALRHPAVPEGVDFTSAYIDGVITALAGARRRAACTATGGAQASSRGGRDAVIATLRDHAGYDVDDGLVMKMPCAHAAPWPTRHAGQTTASLLVRLAPGDTRVWATGTSSPCLSVFKPVSFDDSVDLGPAPRADGADAVSLWWRHERLHRAVLASWRTRATFVQERARALETQALAIDPVDGAAVAAIWAEHRAAVVDWRLALPPAESPSLRRRVFGAWWRRHDTRDGLR